MSRAAVILAAGKGTRMRSRTIKVLHEVGGRKMVDWSLALADGLGCDKRILVIGTHSEELEAVAKDRVGPENIAVQDPPMGTGHAVQSALSALEGFSGNVVVLYADTPLLPVEAVESAFRSLDEGYAVSVLGFDAADPGAYGRLVCSADGELLKIVEAKEASPEELAVRFCNSGVMAVKAEYLSSLLSKISNDNAKGEYYLTDIVELARSAGLKAGAVKCDEEDVLGVNSREQLAEAEAVFQKKARKAFMEAGVTLVDPNTVYFSFDTMIAEDVKIEPNVVFGPGVTIARDTIVRAFSHLEQCDIGENCQIGPFARLRPGAKLHKKVRVGNFVEVKNSELRPGVAANHLSYIGDGDVGAGTNIGAGTIFCNYDGYFKHRTEIGANAFIGSNSALVAPVSIGEASFIGSGSVVTENVPDRALALGRGRQKNIEGWSDSYHVEMKRKKQER
ncbi:bifunctional UDP-N-acetylglucosamine diphosphorylase/glucosamine-1-phosphate N-acetyltransferase GlmU [Ponticaulis sp.]|uniref:bifunctional UDP-N-acetylglucosamine diphosphorylase/glucosamine-1-phosphate N-acetyltransferase GlmU n=1 Tax=Ponticaulis sp. TaxID=2020902 RepID=UPI000B65A02E|nr:bifunctional UDP-N-acetylglucosamine diphosphorylase/glucosamine-1-phosphate N-acetyltransferase GlmU [Ponticaulis sp.]MAI92120.1 bifunctional N-acetylglucosamine-1-phosphate uridyltransferase/glucosamine-1-phosphate acetyltransferase [Ponticaulis sp.]OUX96293.1 MAG: UDP-N-acetylglucosamine diphosphorylase/glucosamine-1-phosphate N-acetyltransferase [Hyphomonadaceae bacterium TMED5]